MQDSLTYFIRIIYNPSKEHEKHKAIVTPGHCYVKAGDVIYFLTNIGAEMWFPGMDELFEKFQKVGDYPENFKIPLPSNEPIGPFTVQSTDSGKEYPFAVYINDKERGIRDFAEGCTAPRLIVD